MIDIYTTAKVQGYEQLTGNAAANGLKAVPANCRFALIQVEGQPVRWRDDGTNPTIAIGMRLLPTGEGMRYMGDLKSLRFIEEAASGTVNVTYYV
jgi:hypothetical protein